MSDRIRYTIAPRNEWRELPEAEGDSEADIDCVIMPDAACPFCGATDLKIQADPSITATADPMP
jgi:hypothetical protein